MARLALDRHAAVAAVVAALAVVAPTLGGADHVTGSATSVTARAASVDGDGLGAAERFPADGASVQTAVRVSAEHWGAPACGGNVALGWAPMDAGTNATASWKNPTDAWNNADANFDCRIELNSAVEYDWEKLCSVVAHEMGHLRGHQHSAVDGELMSPIYSGPLGACTRTPDPAAPPPSAAPAPAAAAAAPAAAVPAARRSTAVTRAAKRKLNARRLCARSAAKGRKGKSRAARRACARRRALQSSRRRARAANTIRASRS